MVLLFMCFSKVNHDLPHIVVKIALLVSLLPTSIQNMGLSPLFGSICIKRNHRNMGLHSFLFVTVILIQMLRTECYQDLRLRGKARQGSCCGAAKRA